MSRFRNSEGNKLVKVVALEVFYTSKAYKITQMDEDTGEVTGEAWIPKSQVRGRKEIAGSKLIEYHIPKWLAQAKEDDDINWDELDSDNFGTTSPLDFNEPEDAGEFLDSKPLNSFDFDDIPF